jgi:hypothetical protein
MNIVRLAPFAAACLTVLLHVSGSAYAETDVSDESLKATGERMRQTAQELQQDIQGRLQRLRKERAALEAKQAAERKQEAERARQQAEKEQATLAAVKEAKQRDALAAAQEKARRETSVRVAEAERKRQAELREKLDQETALERAQQESLDAYKAGTKKQTLGTQTQFGVDL